MQRALERFHLSWILVLAHNYLDDDADGMAVMIAFAAMFSLLPILVISFLAVTFLLRFTFFQNVIPGIVAERIPQPSRSPSETLSGPGRTTCPAWGS